LLVAKCLITKTRLDAETETLIFTIGGHFSYDPIALAENTIGRQPQNGGNGDGFTVGGPMYTLNATGVHGVAQPIAFEPGKLKRLGYGYAPAGLAPTLRAGAGDNQLAIAQPTVLMDQGGSVMSVLQDGTVGTLRRETHGHEPVVMQPTAYAFDSLSSNSMKSSNPISGVNEVNISKTLDTSRGLDPSCNQGGIGLVQSMAVRRLTPTECERLQGFPDSYTNIPWRKQPESPDGPRYKALGNSMAVPVMAWIGRRIANAP
jgi:DNA (cytosine-5)-methyltransferase 1